MSVEIWNLEKDLCRCCHAEGSFDNLAEPKKYLQSEEIYSDMLKNCFNIEIVPVPGEMCAMTYKICEGCISRLRYAVSFKKQVQDCEEKFLELYYKNAIRVLNKHESTKFMQPTIVKEEVPEPFLIDFKEEAFPHIDKDTDDEDYHIKEDDEDELTDEETTIATQQKHKTKGKLKDKPKLKRGRPRKIKDETQREAGKEKKGMFEHVMCCGSTHTRHDTPRHDTPRPARPATPPPTTSRRAPPRPAAPRRAPPRPAAPRPAPPHESRSFRLQPGDYRRDGDRYACCRCDKKYDKMCSLRFHIKTKHYKIPRFTCPYCMKGFMTHAPFTIHKLEDHNIDERYYCKACKGTFNTKIQLRKHINNFHMLGERYKCDLCDYESFSFEGMYKHKFKHKTSKDYHCRFCRKSFLRKTTLDLHERIHTGDRRKVCKVCSQAFVQKASLNYHMTKYHPDVNF
ncbi:zinc finger protein 652-B-like [Melitaea cinxia]|uniref:zinc finger protein 652-B-like n=1 Tax=Melitaea cinxia TaxID=113334 RepID=UPI001E26FA29|nr:zinc finger protein 652-B-like [Melitaea cinxia]